MRLADGAKRDNSAIESVSHLLKVSLLPTDVIQLVTSVVKFEDSGLQQYDGNAATSGFFGTVIRSIDDLTRSETLKYDPAHPWINLKASVGAGHTDLEDFTKSDMPVVLKPSVAGCNRFFTHSTRPTLLIGENLTKKSYRLDGSPGGLGIFAPGRNIKRGVEWKC